MGMVVMIYSIRVEKVFTISGRSVYSTAGEKWFLNDRTFHQMIHSPAGMAASKDESHRPMYMCTRQRLNATMVT